MINIVGNIIIDASKRFAGWVDIYKPWVGDNHTTERNLSLQFATAFLRHFEDGRAFMEVPFKPKGGNFNSCHLDAYLSTMDFDILLECKNIYAPSQVAGIQADIDRMDANLVNQIHKRYALGKVPNKTYGVVFAETWYPHVAEWWETGKCNRSAWVSKNSCAGMILRSMEVCQVRAEKKNETLYWLYGVSGELGR